MEGDHHIKPKVPQSTYALAKFFGLNNSYGLIHGLTYHITFVLIFPSDRVQVIWVKDAGFTVIDYDSQADFYSEWEIVMPLTGKHG